MIKAGLYKMSNKKEGRLLNINNITSLAKKLGLEIDNNNKIPGIYLKNGDNVRKFNAEDLLKLCLDELCLDEETKREK